MCSRAARQYLPTKVVLQRGADVVGVGVFRSYRRVLFVICTPESGTPPSACARSAITSAPLEVGRNLTPWMSEPGAEPMVLFHLVVEDAPPGADHVDGSALRDAQVVKSP